MPFKNLDVKKIIIHEIYSRTNDTLIPPNYGTELESLDHEALDALNNRITDAMGSAAKNMEIKISESDSESCVAIAKQLLNSDDDLFIQLSKKIAEKLTNSQTRRGLPGGILAVFSGTSGFPEKKIVGIIKADTHTGFSRKEKKLIFIKDLLLTPQTKLYKIGVFLEQYPNTTDKFPAGWRAFVYDEQISVTNKSTAAKYFYQHFLGCQILETSALLTRQFYDYTKIFIHESDWSEELKSDVQNALITYLKVDKSSVIQPLHFAQSYFPENTDSEKYIKYMTDTKKFPEQAVAKDLSEMGKILQYRKMIFSKNIRIIAPADQFSELISFETIDSSTDYKGDTTKWTQVTIKDTITKQE